MPRPSIGKRKITRPFVEERTRTKGLTIGGTRIERPCGDGVAHRKKVVKVKGVGHL